MAAERQHRLDDRELKKLLDDLARPEADADVPGKQTLAERLDQLAVILRHRTARAATRSHVRSGNLHPGQRALVGEMLTAAPKLDFSDCQALALRDVLSTLTKHRGLAEGTLAAADPHVARRVAPGKPAAEATPAGYAMWGAANQRAVTLYRRATATGIGAPETRPVAEAIGAIGTGTRLPEEVRRKLEAAFGVSLEGVRLHTGAVARGAAEAVFAEAFTVGEDIFFPSYDPTSLRCQETLAHEVMHTIQWRQGRISATAGRTGVSRPDDPLEREAEHAAKSIVARAFHGPVESPSAAAPRSGLALDVPRLSFVATNVASSAPTMSSLAPGVQIVMRKAKDGQASERSVPQLRREIPIGFVDHPGGADVWTEPPEKHGQLVRKLKPATRVFVSGAHPSAKDWLQVAEIPAPGQVTGTSIAQGYVLASRIVTRMPEPNAELYQVVGGDTVERVVARKYSKSVRPGRDLRFYENVLLYINQQEKRKGIAGRPQAPDVFGQRSNGIQLVEGERIWLVSAEYAELLDGVVGTGSLTGGLRGSMSGKHAWYQNPVFDLVRSSFWVPQHVVDDVAGEFADYITKNLKIIGPGIAAILLAAGAAWLAGGVVGMVIMLGLATMGISATTAAIAAATDHGENWLQLAWTARGDSEQLDEASREFMRMWMTLLLAYFAGRGTVQSAWKAGKYFNSLPKSGGTGGDLRTNPKGREDLETVKVKNPDGTDSYFHSTEATRHAPVRSAQPSPPSKDVRPPVPNDDFPFGVTGLQPFAGGSPGKNEPPQSPDADLKNLLAADKAEPARLRNSKFKDSDLAREIDANIDVAFTESQGIKYLKGASPDDAWIKTTSDLSKSPIILTQTINGLSMIRMMGDSILKVPQAAEKLSLIRKLEELRRRLGWDFETATKNPSATLQRMKKQIAKGGSVGANVARVEHKEMTAATKGMRIQKFPDGTSDEVIINTLAGAPDAMRVAEVLEAAHRYYARQVFAQRSNPKDIEGAIAAWTQTRDWADALAPEQLAKELLVLKNQQFTWMDDGVSIRPYVLDIPGLARRSINLQQGERSDIDDVLGNIYIYNTASPEDLRFVLERIEFQNGFNEPTIKIALDRMRVWNLFRTLKERLAKTATRESILFALEGSDYQPPPFAGGSPEGSGLIPDDKSLVPSGDRNVATSKPFQTVDEVKGFLASERARLKAMSDNELRRQAVSSVDALVQGRPNLPGLTPELTKSMRTESDLLADIQKGGDRLQTVINDLRFPLMSDLGIELEIENRNSGIRTRGTAWVTFEELKRRFANGGPASQPSDAVPIGERGPTIEPRESAKPNVKTQEPAPQVDDDLAGIEPDDVSAANNILFANTQTSSHLFRLFSRLGKHLPMGKLEMDYGSLSIEPDPKNPRGWLVHFLDGSDNSKFEIPEKNVRQAIDGLKEFVLKKGNLPIPKGSEPTSTQVVQPSATHAQPQVLPQDTVATRIPFKEAKAAWPQMGEWAARLDSAQLVEELLNRQHTQYKWLTGSTIESRVKAISRLATLPETKSDPSAIERIITELTGSIYFWNFRTELTKLLQLECKEFDRDTVLERMRLWNLFMALKVRLGKPRDRKKVLAALEGSEYQPPPFAGGAPEPGEPPVSIGPIGGRAATPVKAEVSPAVEILAPPGRDGTTSGATGLAAYEPKALATPGNGGYFYHELPAPKTSEGASGMVGSFLEKRALTRALARVADPAFAESIRSIVYASSSSDKIVEHTHDLAEIVRGYANWHLYYHAGKEQVKLRFRIKDSSADHAVGVEIPHPLNPNGLEVFGISTQNVAPLVKQLENFIKSHGGK